MSAKIGNSGAFGIPLFKLGFVFTETFVHIRSTVSELVYNTEFLLYLSGFGDTVNDRLSAAGVYFNTKTFNWTLIRIKHLTGPRYLFI